MFETQNNNREVKKLLSQYKRTKELIRDLERQSEDMGEQATCIKSTSNISGMPRGGVPYTVADLLADKDEIDRRIKKLETVAAQRKEIVQTYIDTVLSVRHNRFLTLYYIRCMTIDQISDQEGYVDRSGYRIFSEALDMVDTSINL